MSSISFLCTVILSLIIQWDKVYRWKTDFLIQITIWILDAYHRLLWGTKWYCSCWLFLHHDWSRSRVTHGSAQRTDCNNSLKSSVHSLWDKTEEETGRSGFFNSWHWVRQEEKLEGRDGTGRQNCFHRSQGRCDVCQAEVKCHFCTGLGEENRGLWKSRLTSPASAFSQDVQCRLIVDLCVFRSVILQTNGITRSLTSSQPQPDWNSTEPTNQPTKQVP